MAVVNAAKRIFRKHPVIVNSVVYGTLYVGAEFSQQTLTRKILVKDNPQPFDTGVLKRYAVIGTFIYPNILYAWYLILVYLIECIIPIKLLIFLCDLFFFKCIMFYARYEKNLLVMIFLDFGLWNVIALFVRHSILFGNVMIQSLLLSVTQNNGKPVPYDAKTITHYGVLGLGFFPQVYYYWYKWLDRKYVGTAAKTIIKKLVLDQFLLTPPLLVVFYVSMNIMEKKTDLFEECRNKLLPTFKSSCMFWLPAQTLNFMLVPPAARVIYVGTCAFAWVNILCWIKRQDY